MSSLKYEDKIPTTISYNGVEVKTVWFNDVLVWSSVVAGSRYFNFNWDSVNFTVPENVNIIRVESKGRYGYIRVNEGQVLSVRAEYQYNSKPNLGYTYWYIDDRSAPTTAALPDVHDYGHGRYPLILYWSNDINNYTGETSDFRK